MATTPGASGAGPQARKTLELRLVVTADRTGAAREMTALAADAERTGRMLSKAQQMAGPTSVIPGVVGSPTAAAPRIPTPGVMGVMAPGISPTAPGGLTSAAAKLDTAANRLAVITSPTGGKPLSGPARPGSVLAAAVAGKAGADAVAAGRAPLGSAAAVAAAGGAALVPTAATATMAIDRLTAAISRLGGAAGRTGVGAATAAGEAAKAKAKEPPKPLAEGVFAFQDPRNQQKKLYGYQPSAAQQAGNFLWGAPAFDQKTGKLDFSKRADGVLQPLMTQAKAFAPALIAMQAARQTKAVADVYHDETLTGDQANRALFRGSLPFGGTVLDYVDSLSGRTRAMARAGEQNQILTARQQGELEVQSKTAGLYGQTDPMLARAKALEGAQPVLMPSVDRSTVAGERQFRLESQMLGIKQKSAAAERDAVAAAEERAMAEKRAVEFAEKGRQVAVKQAAVQKELEGLGTEGVVGRNRGFIRQFARAVPFTGAGALGMIGDAVMPDPGPRRQELLLEAERLYGGRREQGQLEEQERNRAFQARQRELQARAQAKMSEAESLKVRADDAGERAGRASSLAAGIGGAGPVAPRFGRQAIEYIERVGIDRATPEIIAAAERFAPTYIGKLKEQAGAKSPEFRFFAEKEGLDDPKKLQEEQRKLINESITKMMEGEKELADALANISQNHLQTMTKLFKELGDVLEKVARDLIKRLNNQPAR